MIELFTCVTQNGKKIPIFVEEAGLEYELHKLDIGKGEQHDPAYLKTVYEASPARPPSIFVIV